jgi:RNA polymerase sigma factor (sigma-70 family)
VLVQPEDEILDVDRALADLAALEPRLARVVEMRYFAGMKESEIAAALGVTDRTVRRDWEKARLLLAHALRPDA